MDYEYLRKKLKKNEISGAILDVFSEEPIKRNSKFWNTPNLVITPHIYLLIVKESTLKWF